MAAKMATKNAQNTLSWAFKRLYSSNMLGIQNVNKNNSHALPKILSTALLTMLKQLQYKYALYNVTGTETTTCEFIQN